MANALPLLVLAGGAALLLSKKKSGRKKKGAGVVVPLSELPPAPKGSTAGAAGSSASRETWKKRQTALVYVAAATGCNCNPGKIDGVYGRATKKAIKAFQSYAGIGVDGRWGPKTEAAMTRIVVEIAKGIIKKVTSAASAAKVTVGAREVYISPDYGQLKIGSSWRIAVLDQFLEQRRLAGSLITDPKGIDITDLLVNDPSQFIGELLGFEGETAQNVGYAIYGALWIMATGGLAAEAMVASGAVAISVPITVEAMAASTGIVMAGSVYGAAMSHQFDLWDDEVMAGTALQSVAAFMRTHYAKVGSKLVRLDKLPLKTHAVSELTKTIIRYTHSFQKRTFEG